MKWLLLFTFLPFLLTALYEEPHFVTAYIGEPGKLDCLVSYSRYSTNHFWNKSGKKLPTYNRFSSDNYLAYGEYAINQSNSCFVHGGYSRVIESLNGNSCAFKDTELGWKHLLYKDCAALTLQVIAIVPSGEKKSSVRYGRAGGAIDLLYSNYFCLFDRSGWVDCDLGYRFYSGFPSDQINASGSVGYFCLPWLQVIASAQLDYGLSNGQSKWNLNNIAFHPNYRLLEMQIEITARLLSHLSASIGITKHVWGRNAGAGGGFFCGLWMDY